MKIYTKTGDKGMTSLVGGKRVEKSSVRIEAYGTVDELNAHIGVLIAELTPLDAPFISEEIEVMERIQNSLFNVGTHLATEAEEVEKIPSAMLPQGEVERIEQHIDTLSESLPPLRGFVLPGGTKAAALAHVCRTVCRRAERRVIALRKETEVAEEVVAYVNRLSDYFFLLSRKCNFIEGNNEKIWSNTCK